MGKMGEKIRGKLKKRLGELFTGPFDGQTRSSKLIPSYRRGSRQHDKSDHVTKTGLQSPASTVPPGSRPLSTVDMVAEEQLPSVHLVGDLKSTNLSLAQAKVTVHDIETKAVETIRQLKTKLQHVRTAADFWETLTEGMLVVAGAQYAFVSKKVANLGENGVARNPPTPPCEDVDTYLLGLVVNFNDRKGNKHLRRDWKYKAGSFMALDKVIVIPSCLPQQYQARTDSLTFSSPAEAYLSIPLRLSGECIGHMGLLWSKEGLQMRPQLSWSFLEMFLYALEDLICGQIIQPTCCNARSRLVHSDSTNPQPPRFSLKPYARSVSHELRTPMQGVVGILDLLSIAATEITQMGNNVPQLSDVVSTMLENIKIAQDSASRAIYAAENMVHAYDFDMEVPSNHDSEISREEEITLSLHYNNSKKRRGSSISDPAEKREPTNILNSLDPSPSNTVCISPSKSGLAQGRPRSSSSPALGRLPMDLTPRRSTGIVPTSGIVSVASHSPTPPGTVSLIFDAAGKFLLNSRPIGLRKVLHDMIHEYLKIGGRPDETYSKEIELGELITVIRKSSTGTSHVTTIELKVDFDVPNFMIIDEMALKKLLGCVFHNSVKFTEGGHIKLAVTNNNPPSRFLLFRISDTGKGIQRDFLPNLFEPFATEDPSITRRLDGLGLGLMVAKGLARKMGGDVWCERTATEGPSKGSEFLIKLPLAPANASSSLPGTPLKSLGSFMSSNPTPAIQSLALDVKRLSYFDNKGSQFLQPEALPLLAPRVPQSSRVVSSSFVESARMTVTAPRAFSTPQILSPPVSPTSRVIQLPPPPTIIAPRHGSTSVISPPASIPTTFKFPHSQTVATYAPNRNLNEFHPLKILVVEDNQINRALLSKMIRKLGYSDCDICEAVNGLDAVRKFEEIIQKDYGNANILVLMDIWMPGMDGFEASKRILNISKQREGVENRVKILAVSADVTQEAMGRSVDVGMSGFLPKPFRMGELERAIVGVTFDKEAETCMEKSVEGLWGK